jgi:hypothetical protein
LVLLLVSVGLTFTFRSVRPRFQEPMPNLVSPQATGVQSECKE